MKRALTMLGAIAALALGTFFGAPVAHAQVPTCTPYPAPPLSDTTATGINNWPRTKEKNSNPAHSSFYNCLPSAESSKGTVVWQAAQTIGHQGSNVPPPIFVANLFYQNKIRVYVFHDLNQLNNYFLSSYTTTGKFFGVTTRAGETLNPDVPVNSVGIVIGYTDSSSVFHQYNDNTIKSTTYHELGHAFDVLFNKPSTMSLSHYQSALENDKYDLNSRTRAQAFPTNLVTILPSCTAVYNDVAKSNWDVARCQWEYQTRPEEMFANIFAQRVGGLLGTTDNLTLLEYSAWLTNVFWGETQLYMDTIDVGYIP